MSIKARCETLPQWLTWLETAHPEHDIELSLERIKSVATDMALLKPAPFVITVAGTNGKGSTIALLESILLAAGYKVGVFTSPHFLHFNERIHINGNRIDNESLCSAFAAIDESRRSTWLTYFEFCTLAALHCFTKQSLNIVILEVGLGGRLDATNIIDSDVAVITTIGLDHQDWLGYSLDAIGREKAGIMRPQRPAVYGAIDMPSSIQKHATELNAPLYRRGLAFDGGENKDNWFWSGLSTVGNSVKEQDLPIPKLELDNAITALQVLQFLPQPVSHQQIILGLEKAALPGRAQTIQWRNKKGYLIDVVLDVAHNPQAAERLAAFLHKTKKTGKTTAVFAIASDKDRISVLDLLKPHINHWFITAFDSPRALSLAVLTKTLEQIDAEFTPSKNVIEGFTQAVNQSAQEDRVLVTGSFMTVAKVLALVRELPK